ncbi:MAG: hypothetical protein NXI32_27510, partial [bacterium]|nr:hypothetical protein [bacterium]
MNSQHRGGNSRLLAKHLDSLDRPAAFMDAKGHLVYVNAALCEMANADATQLVGKQVCWEIPADDIPFHSLLTALAPPAAAREGRIAVRSCNLPISSGYQADSQLFLPVTNAAGDV